MALLPLPNGAKVSLSKTIAAPKIITATTNANPAVASSATHGYANGSVLLADMPGWTIVDGSVVRVASTSADTFVMEGVDATDVTRFPPTGAGRAQLIADWTPLPKIPSFQLEGGDAKTQSSSYLDFPKDMEFIIGANSEKLSFEISYQPDSDAYKALRKASDSGITQVVKLELPNGDALYYPGQLFFNKSPTTAKDQEMVNKVMLVLQGEMQRFAKV